ncbi:MAG: (2Fe-2S)-binding protein [Campylobacteraceae bacterium]|nr:(2Fe-2S)-binding protein [Campylobacteraceae bacterium]
MAQKFLHSYIVCSCKNVSLSEILFAIKEKNAKNLKDIAFYTDAGSACGSCTCKEKDVGEKKMDLYLSQILDKYNKK